MTTVYCARWVLPVSASAIANGALAVDGDRIVSLGTRDELVPQFPHASIRDLGDAAIIPGLINAHSHLELTAMRGFLDNEEGDFLGWLKKLTMARLERMTADDLYVSTAWGACEALRAGVTCVADASDSAATTIRALKDVGLSGTVFQESFGPDARLATQHFEALATKIVSLREQESSRVKVGVSPHSPYTVSGALLQLIARFAATENLPLMIHAAESAMEVAFLRTGEGAFADNLRARSIDWKVPGVSPIRYLADHGILETQPLLAHCIQVDDSDIELMQENNARVAHCPKSNAKLGHGVAPLRRFINAGLRVGIGSDSVASNNTCDLFEEARFALLVSRLNSDGEPGVWRAHEALRAATLGGAEALSMDGEIGELRAGLRADFAVVSLKDSRQIPSYDPVSTLIFTSSASDVLLTVIAGEEVYRDGDVTTVDEKRLRVRIKEIAEKLQD